MGILVARSSAADLDVIKALLEAGKLRPVFDRSFP